MEEAEFDKFAAEYQAIHSKNIAVTGEPPEYFAEYKIRDLRSVCDEFLADPSHISIIDFGSGVGTSIPYIRQYMPNARLTCVDVSSKSLDLGRERFGGEAAFLLFDGHRLPLPDSSFHIAFAACVFHHIDYSHHVPLLSELRRVLTPGGIIFIYEHNPYNLLTRHAVNSCPFDQNARMISAKSMGRRLVSAGFANPIIRYRVFFPAALRALRPFERWLKGIPLGAQYYAAACKR